MKLIICASILLFSASCALPKVKSPQQAAVDPAPSTQGEAMASLEPGKRNASAWVGQGSSEPQLYSRDGTPIRTQEPGTIAVTPQAGRTSGQEEGSRWTLLEQYQSAITVKEELEFEVNALNSALDQAEGESLRLQQTNAELLAQLQLYEQRIEVLKSENVDLAARLTTAQVRRLQSEKLLLEAKLDWKRVEVAINQPLVSSAKQPLEPEMTGKKADDSSAAVNPEKP